MKINGLPVVDAKKKLNITITGQDCSKGKTKDPGSCAAARAILRQTHCKKARVHLGRTYIQKGNKWVRYQTPQALRSEIISFDRGAKFDSGKYTLSPMSAANRLGMDHRGGPKTNKKKKRARPHFVTGVREYGANK